MRIYLPNWADTTVLAGVLAVVGYVGNLIVQSLSRWRGSQMERRASLLKLASLLHTMRAAYEIQSLHRNSLNDELLARFSSATTFQGYEERFSNLFKDFSKGELEVHSLIRGITVYALRPLNDKVQQWLDGDVYYRTRRRTAAQRELARSLEQLAAHLSLWGAKYETWIPGQPSHALVYLADDKHQGIGFPRGIETQIDRALHEPRRHSA